MLQGAAGQVKPETLHLLLCFQLLRGADHLATGQECRSVVLAPGLERSCVLLHLGGSEIYPWFTVEVIGLVVSDDLFHHRGREGNLYHGRLVLLEGLVERSDLLLYRRQATPIRTATTANRRKQQEARGHGNQQNNKRRRRIQRPTDQMDSTQHLQPL